VVGDVLDADEELDVDLVLAGDVFYEQPMARHVERFCDEASAAGVDVVVGDPGREYLPRRRVTALGRYDVTGTLDLEGGATTTTTVYRFT
jgi:predicted nicotinamide N-methyase